MTKRVYLDSIGCRLNQSEIADMTRQFAQLGYIIVEDPSQADLFVANTCAVTRNAGKDSRNLVRRMHRHNPDAEIAVTGCYAHIAPQQVQDLPGVAHVLDNFQKDKLVPLVSGETFDAEPLQRHYVPGTGGNTRAFVKVQDGCDNACTFCVTTIARGQGRSRPLEDIVREVQYMHGGGYQEAVLTGVHLGSYGHDFGNKAGLRDLIQALLDATAIPRIRLSSLEPWDIAPGFFELWQNPRLCRHLHLPLQSGCDATLRRMRRNTSQSAFREIVNAARAAIPGLALSTDLIVGFPGETEDEFEDSLAFTRDMDFMKIHVFPYSVREGTPAAKLRGRIPKEIAKARVHTIQTLSAEGHKRFYTGRIGQTGSVLWEGIRGASEVGYLHIGLTDDYIRVEMSHPYDLTNTLSHVRYTHLTDRDMMGAELLIAPQPEEEL